MKNYTNEILNDDKLIVRRDEHFRRLDGLFSGQKQNSAFYLHGISVWTETDPVAYEKPELWVEKALDFLAKDAEKIMEDNIFRPLCIEFGPYGVHFIDKILGCTVKFDDSSKQWYNEYLDNPIGKLQYPDLENNDTWLLARRIAIAFKQAEVKLPLFGLPTIASAINIAVNLYGQKILLALHAESEEAKHDLDIINKLLCDIHGWYLENIPIQQLQPVIAHQRTQPPGYGQLCGCSNQLISPDDYRKFFAPLDNKLLSIYPQGGMIHLCGSHTHHIPVWREMKSFKAFQLNDRAADDLEIYFKKLRDDQIVYLNPYENMTIEKALNITGGQRLVIVADKEQNLKCNCGCNN